MQKSNLRSEDKNMPGTKCVAQPPSAVQDDFDIQDCLRPTQYIDSDHATVRDVADKLLAESMSAGQRAVKLFYFVRDEIRYNPYASMMSPQDYKASEVLARGYGFCTQKAIVLAALSRCAKVPCRLGFADVVNHLVPQKLLDLMGTNLFTYHGYVEFYLHGKWVKATPAFDLGLCEKQGYIPVDFNGENDAVFHPVDRRGRKHIEYARHIGEYQDLPLDDIFNAFEKVYSNTSPELIESWKSRMSGAKQCNKNNS